MKRRWLSTFNNDFWKEMTSHNYLMQSLIRRKRMRTKTMKTSSTWGILPRYQSLKCRIINTRLKSYWDRRYWIKINQRAATYPWLLSLKTRPRINWRTATYPWLLSLKTRPLMSKIINQLWWKLTSVTMSRMTARNQKLKWSTKPASKNSRRRIMKCSRTQNALKTTMDIPS